MATQQEETQPLIVIFHSLILQIRAATSHLKRRKPLHTPPTATPEREDNLEIIILA